MREIPSLGGKTHALSSVMSQILKYFARGMLAVLPIALTLYALYWVVAAFDELVGVSIPGLGLLLSLCLITFVGFLVSNVIGRGVINLFEAMLSRVPLVKLVYGSLKDVLQAFVGDKKTFGRPVSVQLENDSSICFFGFLTRDSLEFAALPEHVAVYIPQAYNIGGQVLAIPKERVTLLDMPPSELLTFMLSGGASGVGR